ncbi:hypothetical protein GCM10022393_26490 [Aquimarina addita]|uniref:F5/8 type C domain-containing protein n=1 Tax=Aquimarina addita TaxID=870485 RepID=A0ABP6UM45_9FLAO
MKHTMFFSRTKLASFFVISFLFFFYSCTKEEFSEEISSKENDTLKSFITIQNPGFELGKVGWGDESNYSISGDEYSGSRAGKVTSSTGKIEQTVVLERNTDFSLSAWVEGQGTLSIGGKTVDFDTTDGYEKIVISFNSSDSSSAVIVGTRSNGDVRFDDFILEIIDSSSSAEIGVIKPISASSNGNQNGYDPENTIDQDLAEVSRWSSNGAEGKYITYDLGAIKTLTSLKIAWLKGDERKAYFKIRVSNFPNKEFRNVYNAKTTGSSGTTEGFETYEFEATKARYVRISCFGNSLNSWNSIIETEIYGQVGDPGTVDTTPPSPVRELIATAGDASVALSWNNPDNEDFKNVQITYDDKQLEIEGNSTVINGLTNEKLYTFTIVAMDTSGNSSDVRIIEVTPKGDIPPVSGGGTPASILSGLEKWKITFPLDKDGNDSMGAQDCDDRNRNAFEIRDITGNIPEPFSKYFYVDADEVVFKAHVGGATTSGSSYTRSELRQTPGGDDNYWSMQDYQYLDVRVRATHLPVEKPEVSMVQIHGPDDEPLRVEYRADRQGLHVVQNENSTAENVLPYMLGEQLRVTVTVDKGVITCRIINESRPNLDPWEDEWIADDTTGYFKVGCYTQSSMTLSTCKPNEGYSNEAYGAYGEVRVKDMSLQVTY